jgi:hypothetical protein
MKQGFWKRPVRPAMVAIVTLASAPVFSAGPTLFVVSEGSVPGALEHSVSATAMEFSYHGCTKLLSPGHSRHLGYLRVSAFSGDMLIAGSQVNDFEPNGYGIYGVYSFDADACGTEQTCSGGTRRNSSIGVGFLQLWLDPLADTTITLPGCSDTFPLGSADDLLLGVANVVQSGQLSETADHANGDFDIVFSDWSPRPAGQALFRDHPGNPLTSTTLVFNANVTRPGGPLVGPHFPDGSGNLYWKD